jgi:hypothetical protein
MKKYFSAALVIVTLSWASTALAQEDKDFGYFFFAKSQLAKRKIIPVSELTACMLGDTLKPSVSGKFKSEVSATALNQARLIESGACDVGLFYDHRPDRLDRVKKSHPGFAIYKISGSNLELVIEPSADGWIAVGRVELASQSTLEKKELTGCGDGPLRDLFRPNPKIWKEWRQAYVKFEDLKTAKQLELENVLLYGCDVWIFSPEDYQRFSKKYGTKYPLFDVSPDSPTLTRKK